MELDSEVLRWYFNDDESFAVYTYEDTDDYPLNVTLSQLIPDVMIQILQASFNTPTYNFYSIMTANLSALIQEGVNNITCGSRVIRSSAINTQCNYILRDFFVRGYVCRIYYKALIVL